MTLLVRNKLTLVWVLLSGSTVLSWWFGTTPNVNAVSAGAVQITAVSAVAICLIALLKCGMVLWHFMEVQGAPTWLRLVCTAWLYAFFGTALGLYVWAQ